ncbi:MAG: sugar MFS transporter [Prevotellaceae bacterium]|jgi:FHS family L-fucose permease-like MFS transporter|nr:sugar MFS transporter [Prevotellaceae bacterium]
MSNTKSTGYIVPLVTLTTLFFMWGFITCLNDILIPFLRGVFELSHFQANLVQFAFFTAYFVISLIYFTISATLGDPILKVGYKNTIVAGLLISCVACFLLFNEAGGEVPRFGMFLFSLFLLGSGFAFLQIAANPLVSLLGSADTASSRLNFTQGFNSLGTTIAPVIGGYFIFKYFVTDASSGAAAVKFPYLFLAGILLLLAILIYFARIPNGNIDSSEKLDKKAGALQYPNLVFGMIGLFCYVGAEVTIGSNLISYMKEYHQLDEVLATPFLAYYWGGAMIGRFMGSISMSKMAPLTKYLLMVVAAVATFTLIFFITDVTMSEVVYFLVFLALNYLVFIAARSLPSRTLGYFAGMNIILIGIMLFASGGLSLWSILGVGLFNSIMFSNIFTLAIDGLGKYTSQGSSLLVMMILGGALLPPLQGFIADKSNVHISFVLPLFCYAYLMWYGLVGCKIRRKNV